MNIVNIANIIGTVAIFLIFCLKFYIAVNTDAFLRAGRAAIFWFSVYVFFLFFLRFLSLFHIGTLDQLRIISGFSSLIPLLGIIFHLFLAHRMIPRDDERLDKQL